MVKLLERMEYKDEAINELRQIQQSQEATISKLRKDVDQIKFEKEQLKESFLKCEFAIKSLGSIVENAEYKNKTEETNARDYDNANTLGENMDSSNVSIYRDNPTKRLPIISHLIKRNTNGPTITGFVQQLPQSLLLSLLVPLLYMYYNYFAYATSFATSNINYIFYYYND
ncbi:hypothetical protein DPMN_063878 [Dreissena polymorpha]|uniref:Uncharacterized protein n=1 Tax=Dreissena polymorpha TaxID=45954 RepID=A0A9D4HLL2_DREPO|nr:hypothetical protein DPMN_063878 [Dreissena polymorpha]